MARGIEQFTDKAIKAKRQPGYYCDGGGLYLQVSPTLTKSWIFRYTRTGKTREMGLGSLNAVGLQRAREKARTYRSLLADGKDPLEYRDMEKATAALAGQHVVLFWKYALDYIETHRQSWENRKTAVQWTKSLEHYAKPVLGSMVLKDIDTPHVLRVLKPIWATKRETAERVRRRIENILDAAKVEGYRDGDNPARWRGHLEHLLAVDRPETDSFSALPWKDVGDFMARVRTIEDLSARALELTVLSAVRTHVTIAAVPEEFDLDAALWVIPKDRMKGKKGKRREHRVPLSPRAVEIVRERLQGMIHGNPFLFPGTRAGKPMSNMAMLQLLRRMKRDDITVHGFRSTFRDWAAERTSYPREVCEMALSHAIGNKVEAAYRRGDLFEKRKRLMLEWGRYCATPSAKGEVVSIRPSAKQAPA